MKTRKLLCLGLAVMLACSNVPGWTASAQGVEDYEDGNFGDEDYEDGDMEDEDNEYEYEELGDGTVEITGYNGMDTELEVPEEINGMHVTGIGYDAFNDCDDLISISLPEGLTSIGESAFLNCYSLERINIPDSVTSIGDEAFFSCESLTDISISGNLTRIADSLFQNCESLVSVSIPESVTSIGNSAFNRCSALTGIHIPDGVTNIGDRAFYSCDTLTGIELPDSVTSMGNEVFYGCNNLKNVNISSNVTGIGNAVFKYCSQLSGINIPGSVTNIGDNAFERCSSLTSVNIPESVENIGNDAFLDCSRNLFLTVTKGSYAETYARENALKYLGEGEEESLYTYKELADGTLEINGYEGEDAQLVIPAELYGKKVSGIQESAFGSNDSITSVELAEGITSIGDSAFFWCSNLKSITIPESVTHIGSGVCDMCVNLEEIKVSEKNVSYVSYQGALYNKDKTELLRYPEKNTGNIELPESVTRVGDSALSWCRSNAAVTLPGNVTQIGESAFAYSNFSSIVLSESITDIGDLAFEYCSFQKMELPKGVKHIGDYAFEGCEKLTEINIPENVENIGSRAFSDSIEKIIVDDGNKSYAVEEGILYNKNKTKVIWCPKKKEGKVTLPKGVEEIADSLFYGCKNITGIILPESVKDIGYYAFGNCSSLTEIRIPDSVVSIGGYAFSGCSSLTTVTLPLNLTDIGYGIFGSCNSLKEITIPQGVTDIAASAFEDCSSLTEFKVDNNNNVYSSEDGILYNKEKTKLILCPKGKAGNIVIPESVESVEAGTFTGCSALRSIRFSQNVSSISEWAFIGCSSLTEFIVDGGNNVYASEDGILYNKEMTKLKLILCPFGKTGSITIPANVTDIAEMDFGFRNVEEIIVDVGNSAYASKDGLLYNKEMTKLLMCPSGKTGSVTIPSSVTDIDCGFANVKATDSGFGKVTEIIVDANNTAYASKDGMLYNKGMTKLLMCPLGRTGKITIPDGVEIGYSAFDGCDGITAVEIPADMTSGINSVINGLWNLTDIVVDNGNPVYASRDGILYDKDMTTLLSCPRGKSGNIVIPDGVKYIGWDAFASCDKLSSITLPESVIWIGGKTFDGCSQLKLIVPPGSAAENFAKYAWGNWSYIGEEHTHTYVSTVIREPSCTEAGIRTYTCSECGDSYTESIPKYGHSYQSQITKATLTQNGFITKTCIKCGQKTAETIYVPKTIALSKANLTYNNKNQQPSVTVKDSKGKALNKGTDYSVTYPKAAKNVGQYTVTINLKGNYSGTVKKSFTIVPKGTSLSKVTPKKKGFTVKWKKQKNQTTGYEVAYSTDSKFSKKNTKIVPVKKNGTTSKSIGKLKVKKKYYVRIRTYKTIKGKKYYSSWSKVKNIITKK